MAWFETFVCRKTERGRRVFPVSDKASDVVGALRREVTKNCHVIRERVTGICEEGGEVKGLRTAKSMYSFDRVIVATGGMSYPATGSEGDGFRFAEALGRLCLQTRACRLRLSKAGARRWGFRLKTWR